MAYALAGAAEHLASKGRNGDTMLVHMNPIEVAWLNEQSPGGLTINPDTGQPEAFAFLLPLLAGAVGPGLMGAMGISGLGATLGTAGLTALADYAVNKDPQKALSSGLLSFGLGGLGNAFKGADTAMKGINTAATAVPNAINTATSAIPSGVMTAAKAAMATNPALNAVANAGGALAKNAMSGLANTGTQQAGGLLSKVGGTMGRALQDPRAAFNAIKANPYTIAAPLAAGTALTASNVMQPMPYRGPEEDDKYKGDYQRERFPGPRTRNQYTGDIGRYGVEGGEFNYFTPNNDRMASPPILGMQGLGAYGMAMGGAVLGEGDGVSDSIPAIGPGQRPIQLSDGEYVIPADVVSMLGKGSTNGGIRYLDAMIAKTRDNPPRQEKGSPPQRRAA